MHYVTFGFNLNKNICEFDMKLNKRLKGVRYFCPDLTLKWR